MANLDWKIGIKDYPKLRALQTLEMIRKPAAKSLLTEWAKSGDPIISDDAAEAIKRLR